MTRQSTNQAQQRARVSQRRAKAARHRHHLVATGQRPRRTEMTRTDLAPWFVMAWRRLAKMSKGGGGV